MYPFAIMTLLFSISVTYLVMKLGNPYPPISKFPEIWLGHTAVHTLEHGFPAQPAYMVWQEKRLMFYDLFTNRSIGDLYAYTGAVTYKRAYARVYLTAPSYRRRSLYQYFSNSHLAYHGPVNPTIQAIINRRNQFWWPVAVRQHQELVARTYGSFLETLYDIRLNRTINYTVMYR